MWLCEGKYVTRNIGVHQPASMRPSGQGGVHPTATRAVGWGSGGTDCTKSCSEYAAYMDTGRRIEEQLAYIWAEEKVVYSSGGSRMAKIKVIVQRMGLL